MEGRKGPFWLTAWGTVHRGRKKVKAAGGWDSWSPCVPFLQLRTPVHGMRLPIFRVSLPKKHLHRYTQSCLSKSNQLDNDNLTATHTGKSYRKKKSQTTRYISIRSKRPPHLPRGLLSHHFPRFALKETWLFRGVCSPPPRRGAGGEYWWATRRACSLFQWLAPSDYQ